MSRKRLEELYFVPIRPTGQMGPVGPGKLFLVRLKLLDFVETI